MGGGLVRLAGTGHREALPLRRKIASLALRERNEGAAASGGGRLASISDYVLTLAPRTVGITLLAGSGSRWVESLAAARSAPPREGEEEWRSRGRSYDPSRPRGLFPVRDHLRHRSPGRDGLIPIAAYALSALHGLGRHLIVVRGWEREIDGELLAPLEVSAADRVFFTQEAALGKPLGHGDAVWQCRSLWKDADYVLANFGGDASSRRTARSALLALDALNALGEEIDLLVPAAPVREPSYPIVLDAEGRPRSFGHAKLQGRLPAGGARESGYTNVGLRLYRAGALFDTVERFRRDFWVEGEGYAIPGNDPAGREFALDNVDAQLAARGRARILAFARPQELRPAKSLEDIPAFEAAVADVVAEDSLPEEDE